MRPFPLLALAVVLPAAPSLAQAPVPPVLDQRPRLVAAVAIDVDGDGLAGFGDEVRVRFDRDVLVQTGDPAVLRLLVAGDTFGAGATLLAGPTPDTATVRLGTAPVLKARGRFGADVGDVHRSSGIDVARDIPSGAIVDALSGATATASAVRDLRPGFVDQHMNLGPWSTEEVHWLDLEPDGDMDLITRETGGVSRVWIDDGTGLVQFLGQTFGSNNATRMVVGDIDQDADADVLEARSGFDGILVWTNDGLGNFSPAGVKFGSHKTQSIVLGDVNRDGFPDAITVNDGQPELVYLNDGIGGFHQSQTLAGTSAGRVGKLADLNADGWPDLLVGNTGELGHVWLGAPGGLVAGDPWGDDGQTLDVALLDEDGDGDLDVAELLADGAWRLWHNDGTAHFTLSVAYSFSGAPVAIAAEDLDGDGGLDVLLGTGDGTLRTFWRIGPQAYFDDPSTRVVVGSCRDFELADVDRDGDPDVAFACSGADSLWEGCASGFRGAVAFPEEALVATPRATQALVVADFDADGDLDFIDAAYDQEKRLWTNDGSGTFSDGGSLPVNSKTRDLVGGDLDLDGDIDLVEITRSPPEREVVWLRQDDGTWLEGQSLFGVVSNRLDLADVDGDGDLDLVSSINGANRVRFNHGDGTFSTGGPLLGKSQTADIELGDIDLDGDLDMIEANGAGQASRVWWNLGAGDFVDSGQALGSASTVRALLFDMDRDGDLDVWLGNTSNQPDEIWLNDGTGHYSLGSTLPGAFTSALALGDLDGDGDLDVAVGRPSDKPDEVWWNVGDGTFVDSGMRLGTTRSADLRLGDFDGDGDLDLLVGNDGQFDLLWIQR